MLGANLAYKMLQECGVLAQMLGYIKCLVAQLSLMLVQESGQHRR